jgi:hypothetical protein
METSRTVRHYLNGAVDIGYDAPCCIPRIRVHTRASSVFDSTRKAADLALPSQR